MPFDPRMLKGLADRDKKTGLHDFMRKERQENPTMTQRMEEVTTQKMFCSKCDCTTPHVVGLLARCNVCDHMRSA